MVILLVYRPGFHTIKECFLPCSYSLDTISTITDCSSRMAIGSETEVDEFCKQYFYGSDRKGHTKDTKCIVDPNTINKNSKGATMYYCQDSSFICCQEQHKPCNRKSNPLHDPMYPNCCKDLSCHSVGENSLGLCLPIKVVETPPTPDPYSICSIPLNSFSPNRKSCGQLSDGHNPVGYNGTKQDVDRICKSYFHPDSRTMCSVDPTSSEPGGRGAWWSCMDSSKHCPTPPTPTLPQTPTPSSCQGQHKPCTIKAVPGLPLYPKCCGSLECIQEGVSSMGICS